MAGCEFIDLGVSAAETGRAERQAARRARSPLRTLAVLRSSLTDQARAVVTSLANAAQPGEVIVSGTLTVATATAIAGLRGSRVVALNPVR